MPVKEAIPLLALLDLYGYGPYVEDVHGPMWRKPKGVPRILPTNKSSENLQLIRETVRYRMGESDGSWLVQWCNDELSGFTGLFARENGCVDYDTFMVACISDAKRVAESRGQTSRAEVFRRWLRQAWAWMWMFVCQGLRQVASVGQRNQGHDADVQLAMIRGVPQKRIFKQKRYWPVAVMGEIFGGEMLTMAEAIALLDVGQGKPPEPWMYAELHTRNRFQFWRWEHGGAIAMLREKGEVLVGYGSPCYAACWGPDGEKKLEPDAEEGHPRKALDRTCRAGVEDGLWTAAASSHPISLDTTKLGALIYTATCGPKGMEVVPA